MDEHMISVAPQSGVLDKVTFGLLLLVVFLAPLFFVPGSFISVQYGTSLLFAFGVIASTLVYIISILKKGSMQLPASKWFVSGGLVAVPLLYTLSSLSHGVSRMSFFGYTFDISTVGFMLLSFMFLFLIVSVFKSRSRVFYSYVAVVVSLILVGLFLAIRIFFGPQVLSFGIFNELTSTVLGSWNSTGIFFGIGAILSLLTYEMLTLTKGTKILVSLALFLSLFFLAMVNFSTIWVIVAITALLFITYRLFSTNDIQTLPWSARLKKVPVYSLIVFIIAVIFTLWGATLGGAIANKFKVTNVEVRPTLSVTLAIAKNTFATQPIFGSGPNTFTSQWLSYKPADINSTIFWDTDFAYGVGLLPTFAVTTGILGVLAWIAFFAVYLYFGFKGMFSKGMDQLNTYLLASAFFISLYLWIMTFIYVPSIVVMIMTFFFTGLFFALLCVQGIVPTKTIVFSENPRIGFLSTLALVSVFVGAVLVGYGLFNNSKALWYFQKSAAAANGGDLTNAEVNINKAIATVPYDVYYRAQSQIAIAEINSVLNQDLSKADKTQVQNFFTTTLSKAITAGFNAEKADPKNYLNWISLGQAYAIAVPPQTQVTGAYEGATTAYTKALDENPQNPAISLLFARLEASKNDLAKAKRYAIQAINQKPNYIDAYYLIAQLEVTDKNLKGAIDSVTQASVIDPTNAGTFFQLGLLKYDAQDFTGAIDAFTKSLTIAPDYANSKYFLGLSYVLTGRVPEAIALFTDLAKTNPDSKEVQFILANLKAGKSPFTNAQPPITSTPTNRKTPPVNEKQ